ncbi:MAG: zinc ribbon domain-containing protein [Thermoplasmata archaeon]|nr:zinc ribbon domain-containing protein [Thermoplasmata archaeon]MBE3137974.1 zinc ribbon domain-containing protein [Thermoplasmata archaeon]MBE3140771.1 zinc ribbon domain-containing protein [Thermoplasmata archaeon]
MVDCPNCRKNNVDDAAFCTKCGTSLKPDAASPLERHAKMFAQDMQQMGKNLGESMTHAASRIQGDSRDVGKRFEQRVDQAGKHIENWYDRTFGVLGPLLASFLFLIILRLAIEIARISGDDVPEMSAITSVILLYLLPLFGTTLLSNYISYFARKSFKFRIFSPLFHSIALIIFLWIVTKILDTLRYRLQNADLGTAAVNIENSLPTVFVFVLLIGYVILAITMPREQEKKP